LWQSLFHRQGGNVGQLVFHFKTEITFLAKEEADRLGEQIGSLYPTVMAMHDKNCVSHEIVLTLIDGKVCKGYHICSMSSDLLCSRTETEANESYLTSLQKEYGYHDISIRLVHAL